MGLKNIVVRTTKLVIAVLCILQVTTASAQQFNTFCNVKFRDSLVADTRTRMLYNNISITNAYPQAATLNIHFKTPEGWRLLSDEHVTLSLGPGEKQILSLTFIKLPEASAEWKPVIMDISLGNTKNTVRYTFYLKASSLTSFGVYTRIDNATVSEDEHSTAIPIRIVNTGNVPATYDLNWQSTEVGIEENIKISLPARSDTEYVYIFKIPRDRAASFKHADLQVVITDTAKHTYTHTFYISRSGNEQKMHPSRYGTFPLTIEGGLMNIDKQVAGYGAIHGEIALDSSEKLNFAYRSKQFGNYSTFQQNIWHVEYDRNRWQYYVGTFSESRFFALYNTGARVSYKWKENSELSFSASLHNNLPYYSGYYGNDNAAASIKYALKKMELSHELSANINNTYHINSYIFWNNLKIIKSKSILFELNAATGLDHSTIYRRGFPEEKWGTSLGYLFRYNAHHWNIMSTVQDNSQNYPGILKGQRIENYSVSKQLGQFSLGLFYQYNHTQNNFFRDTLYRSDVLSFNTTRYGVSSGWTGKKMGVALNLGILNQEGLGNAIAPQYPYAELNYNYQEKGFSFRIGTTTGYTNKNGDTTQDIFVTSSSAAIGYKFFGVQGMYTRVPITDANEARPITGYTETLDIGPFVNIRMGKHFSANLMYDFSKTTFDNEVRSFIRGSLNYHDNRRGWDVMLYGSVPLQNTTGTIPGLNSRYLTLGVKRKFDMPVFTQRKYFDLKVVAYYDENSNGKRDDGEQVLENVSIDVNGAIFVTDKSGAFYYDNLERGFYTIDLHNVKNIRGIIPANGFTQRVDVSRNLTYEIPFKKSKLITGSVKVILDSLSPAKFTPDYLKVIATSAAGETFLTLTDESGDFYFNLPAGIYSLSLNPKVFTDFMKPLRMSYKIDLEHNNEAIVIFEIDQKNREIRLKTFKIDTP